MNVFAEAAMIGYRVEVEDLARWGKAFERLDREGEPPSLFVPIFIATSRRRRR